MVPITALVPGSVSTPSLDFDVGARVRLKSMVKQNVGMVLKIRRFSGRRSNVVFKREGDKVFHHIRKKPLQKISWVHNCAGCRPKSYPH